METESYNSLSGTTILALFAQRYEPKETYSTVRKGHKIKPMETGRGGRVV